MRFATAAALCLLLLASGCSDEWPEQPPQGAKSSADHSAEPCATSHSLTLFPSTAAPGELFTVKYPSLKTRTANVFMYHISGSSSTLEFELWHNGQGHTWSRIPDGGTFTTIGSVGKLSSHRAVVPRVARSGRYQICDDAMRICGVLTVQE